MAAVPQASSALRKLQLCLRLNCSCVIIRMFLRVWPFFYIYVITKVTKNKILNHIFLERYVASPLGGAVTPTELIRRYCKFCPATFHFKQPLKKNTS